MKLYNLPADGAATLPFRRWPSTPARSIASACGRAWREPGKEKAGSRSGLDAKKRRGCGGIERKTSERCRRL